MRPCKNVYLHCSDEKRRSVLAFVLETRGYRVVYSPVFLTDVALFVDDRSTYPGETAFQMPKDLPLLVMITPERRAYRISYPANAFFVHDKLSTVELLEWIRIMACRKRGPKPSLRNRGQQAKEALVVEASRGGGQTAQLMTGTASDPRVCGSNRGSFDRAGAAHLSFEVQEVTA